jgi:hypothetical protein
MEKQTVQIFISREIELIHNIEKRSGINRWIILAGLATLVWTFLSIYESHTIDFKYVGANYLFICLFIISIRFLIVFISGEFIDRGTNRPRVYKSNSSDRKQTLFLSLYPVLLAFLGYFNIANKYLMWIFILSCFFFSIILIVTFIVSFFKLPILINRKNKYIKYFFVYIIGISGFLSFQYFKYFNVNDIREFTTIKLTLILIATTYLVFRLLELQVNDSLLDILISIRRSLDLDDISAEIAFEKVKLALLGQTVSNFFEQKINEVLNILTESEHIIRQINDLKDLLDKETEISKKATLIVICSNYTKNLVEKSKQLSDIMKKIREQHYIIFKQDLETKDELNVVLNRINVPYQRLRTSTKDLGERFKIPIEDEVTRSELSTL